MDIEPIYENLLKLKDAVTGILQKDAVAFGFATNQKSSSIEVSTTMMLIWAADYAARQQMRPPVADELLRRVINADLNVLSNTKDSRASGVWIGMAMQHGPNFAKTLYAEFSRTMEKTFPIRNQIGFAFFEHALEKVSIFKGVEHGRRYKELIQKCIGFFVKWNFSAECETPQSAFPHAE